MKVKAIQAALKAAVDKASEEQSLIVVVVLDAAGRQVGQVRMLGAFNASPDYADWKAWTAASFSMSTAEFKQFLSGLDDDTCTGLLAHPRITTLSGGLPIMVSQILVGAIGVSGGSSSVDEGCAKVACAEFLEHVV